MSNWTCGKIGRIAVELIVSISIDCKNSTSVFSYPKLKQITRMWENWISKTLKIVKCGIDENGSKKKWEESVGYQKSPMIDEDHVLLRSFHDSPTQQGLWNRFSETRIDGEIEQSCAKRRCSMCHSFF